jgi:radical SAM protein with 4Fe4S-binding SPASM domain
MRPDILELATLATSLGIRAVLSTNGTLLTSEKVSAIKKAGIKRLSLSLDGPDAESHDTFRGLKGAYDDLIKSAALLNEGGLPFQINSTITPGNIGDTFKILDVAKELGACAYHVFLLVPVGRAKNWSEESLAPEVYESTLRTLKAEESGMNMEFKATCAPQYQRISREMGLISPRSGKGCLGGQGFMFVSYDGIIGACGYLPLPAGDIRKEHPIEIYSNSELFCTLRKKENYKGNCGTCEYWNICGGCRARAYVEGDYLGQEPLCPHQPRNRSLAV